MTQDNVPENRLVRRATVLHKLYNRLSIGGVSDVLAKIVMALNSEVTGDLSAFRMAPCPTGTGLLLVLVGAKRRTVARLDTSDGGLTWTLQYGMGLEVPLADVASPALLAAFVAQRDMAEKAALAAARTVLIQRATELLREAGWTVVEPARADGGGEDPHGPRWSPRAGDRRRDNNGCVWLAHSIGVGVKKLIVIDTNDPDRLQHEKTLSWWSAPGPHTWEAGCIRPRIGDTKRWTTDTEEPHALNIVRVDANGDLGVRFDGLWGAPNLNIGLGAWVSDAFHNAVWGRGGPTG